MKILFIPQAGALGIGGVTRCLAVATEAAFCGHQVAFFCRKEIQEFIKMMIDARIFTAPAPIQKQREDCIKNFTLADSIRIRNMDDFTYLRSTIKVEIETIRQYKPNIIFTENQFSAAISAELTSIPLVTTAASVNHPKFTSPLYDLDEKVPNIESNFNRILKKYSLAPISDISELSNGRSTLNISPTIPELEPLLADFPNNHYVGQLLFNKLEIGSMEDNFIPRNSIVIFVYMSKGSIRTDKVVSTIRKLFNKKHFFFLVATREKTFMNIILPYITL